jgi:hypothetical protein
MNELIDEPYEFSEQLRTGKGDTWGKARKPTLACNKIGHKKTDGFYQSAPSEDFIKKVSCLTEPTAKRFKSSDGENESTQSNSLPVEPATQSSQLLKVSKKIIRVFVIYVIKISNRKFD